MTVTYLMLCLVFGALSYRIRGGLLATWHVPGTLSRIPFALVMGCTVLAAHGSPITALLMVVAVFAAEVTVGNFSAIDLGHHDGTYWQDMDLLTLRGVLFMMPCAIALEVGSRTPEAVLSILIGALLGYAYVAAWALGPRPFGLRFGTAGDPVETAEVLAGPLLVMGVFLPLWLHILW